MRFAQVERGALRIGYLGGRYAFIANLYDRRFTNRLYQLHYGATSTTRAPGFGPDAFVRHIRALDLDLICVFDRRAPGAEIVLANFPDITFVEDRYK